LLVDVLGDEMLTFGGSFDEVEGVAGFSFSGWFRGDSARSLGVGEDGELDDPPAAASLASRRCRICSAGGSAGSEFGT